METITPNPEAWRRHAACRGVTARMYPAGRGESSDSIARAKAVCARCTVTAPCLAIALANHEPAGVWGGLTTEERRPMLTGPNPRDRRDDATIATPDAPDRDPQPDYQLHARTAFPVLSRRRAAFHHRRAAHLKDTPA